MEIKEGGLLAHYVVSWSPLLLQMGLCNLLFINWDLEHPSSLGSTGVGVGLPHLKGGGLIPRLVKALREAS